MMYTVPTAGVRDPTTTAVFTSLPKIALGSHDCIDAAILSCFVPLYVNYKDNTLAGRFSF